MKVVSGSGNEKTVSSAIDIVDQLISVFESEAIANIKKKDSRLNIQIIPNVKRIKLEKVLVARELID